MGSSLLETIKLLDLRGAVDCVRRTTITWDDRRRNHLVLTSSRRSSLGIKHTNHSVRMNSHRLGRASLLHRVEQVVCRQKITGDNVLPISNKQV